MTKSVDPKNDYLNEIIRLQLKKPRRWNWELTTSRSSPHVSLPVIQLFNAKGKLLVEAKESGRERRSWHSNDWAVNNRSSGVLNDNRSLQKCNSDILQRNRTAKGPLPKYDYKTLSDVGAGLNNARSLTGLRSNYDTSKERKESDVQFRDIKDDMLTKRYRKSRSATLFNDSLTSLNSNVRNKTKLLDYKGAIGNTLNQDGNVKRSITIDSIEANTQSYVKDLNSNTKSDFRNKKGALDHNFNITNSLKKYSDKTEGVRNIKGAGLLVSSTEENAERGLKKSRSVLVRFIEKEPDAVLGKSKSLQGYKRSKSDDLYKKLLHSREESIKRAEADGYKKFLNSNKGGLNDNVRAEKMRKEVIQVKKPEANRVRYSRYITRTCSAGTLIIKEESFSNPNLRRRRKTADNDPYMEPSLPSNFSGKELHPKRIGPSIESDIPYPHMLTYKNRQKCEKKDSLALPTYGSLFHSKSDIFPFGELFSSPPGSNEVSTNYTVEEPSSESRKNSEDGIGAEKLLEERKRRKVRRRAGDEGLPSLQWDGEEACVKARVVKEHKKDAINDEELLRLVRGLSNDHAKMGANVSRHSSKGLSGRRTQSSGSICNGKGGSGGGGGGAGGGVPGGGNRHTNSEPKICGSLPNYLDETDSRSCNNNHHECEKPHLQDVERIPPLGDGAPLHWKFSDTQTVLCDQGYGSERSPEEEYPPPLPEHDNQCHHHLDLHSCYPFITPESTFSVTLAKGSRGLGLSVTGGVDSGGSWPGLIRVKRLFPHQPAASCEMLNVGDLILEVNGITLTGLTNYEALEVLRTASNQVDLKICRPPPDVLSCVSPISEVPPPPPRRDPPSSLNLTSVSDDEHCLGEFEVTMRKLQGSLGFTLRKEDDSALGHYIRALVREPALTDSRIRAGDKIIAVNDVEISSMTHEEAVQFLRQSGEIVKLRLYRDLAQTPVATLSPTETTPRTSFSKKTQLRQEAVDMLNDIAVRKLIPGNQDVYGRLSQSPSTSPRRLRRQPCPSDASHTSDSSGKHLITDEQFHEGLLKKCSLPLDEDSFNSLFIEDDDCDRPSRPSSLDLYNPNQTPVATRKPKFNFSLAHNAYELNNLDAELLDAPNLTYNLGADDANSTEVECGDSFPQEPASMPHIPTDNPGFSYKNPAYQSAHPQCGIENGDEKTPKALDDSNMKKWKGVVFTADEEKERERQRTLKTKTPKKEVVEEEKYDVLAIEMNRGWNSRLGFSLQGAAGVTYVSAVHADSVAARDGRIKPGDCLIKVNDESVEHMTTSEIIDLLRIVRGPVCIVVSRPKSREDCIRSKAAN